MKKLIIIIIALLLIGYLAIFKDEESQTYLPGSNATTTDTRAMSVEEYVRLNISDLSAGASIEEQVGGTFFVTDIKASGGAGTVSYEDGHNAYTADFTYSVAENGAITLKSFTVRK